MILDTRNPAEDEKEKKKKSKPDTTGYKRKPRSLMTMRTTGAGNVLVDSRHTHQRSAESTRFEEREC